MAEEATCTRERQAHGAEFANKLLPDGERQASLIRSNGLQDGRQAVNVSLRQVDFQVFCVEDPPQDLLGGVPIGDDLA